MLKKFLIPAILLLFIVSCEKSSKKKINTSLPKPTLSLSSGDYVMDNDNSSIKWTGRELSTKSHYGSLQMKNGSLTVNTDGTVNGIIKIDMTTIDCEDLQGRSKASLERHLRSDDFFSVESHPIATLTFKSEGGIGAGNKLAFNGDLEIKGISHPISFESEVKNVDPKVSALVNMTFDRSKYNVRFRSGTFFQNLGDKLIYDDIEISVDIRTL
jgi:polyisoprenoid-binding protein YceI|tara:strand:+ start:270 stop:908 length:639 start_codon:yes stop_codon:yes gene_type:complete